MAVQRNNETLSQLMAGALSAIGNREASVDAAVVVTEASAALRNLDAQLPGLSHLDQQR